MAEADLLADAGLTPAVLEELDSLVVGSGGFVRELIAFTGGASTVKEGGTGQRVSAADVLLDRLLRERLVALVPGSGGYSEEGGRFGSPGGPVRWLVDPVDGTRPATLGGAFAVCVAALVMGEGRARAAAGWVYVPTLSALFRGVLAPGRVECLLNGRPAAALACGNRDELRNRYLAVGSNWRTEWLPRCAMKLSAPGATAVHLVQLVQPGSDVAAATLTRYRPHDAAAGLVVAAAGGAEVFRLPEAGGGPAGPAEEPLAVLGELEAAPETWGPRLVVAAPGVSACLR